MNEIKTTVPRLGIRGLHKSYGATKVLAGIDLDIQPAEVHALVGENGAGKSTLCRIVAGMVTPDLGTLTVDGVPYAPGSKRDAAKAGVRLCLQELSVIDTLSIAENIFLEDLPRRFGLLDRRRLHTLAQPLMDAVGLGDRDPAEPVGALGVGQRQLVEIAGALSCPCRLLILDEPTAALTGTETDQLFLQIRGLCKAGTSVVYISHRLEEIARIADRVTILRDGVLATTCATSTISTEGIIERMVGRAVDENRPETRRPPQNQLALRVTGLRVGGVVRNVSLSLHRGEVLGLSGLMGSGRTETLRAIFGADARQAGEIFIGANTHPTPMQSPNEAIQCGLALVTEDRKKEGLLLPLGLAINVTLGRLAAVTGLFGFLNDDRERAAADTWKKNLGIRAATHAQPVQQLSGGNQQKVVIARWLFRGSEVFLFDEPTRGIDAAARHEIHQLMWALADEGKAVLVASSDLRELMLLCDRIVTLSRGVVAGSLQRKDFSEEILTTAAFSQHLSSPVPETNREEKHA